ncbi:MAG TPA: GntG family PLP-dependent aldolase [Acidimicrobiales bacterium]|nr:GntG family PLP-dependent aldolase [Acidimicrobiales bacterium]
MSNGLVDLRSDTVTKPTSAMRKAMADAEVGDDVYGEDPTVNRLQEMYAELVGMEAALYVPSGTMANQLALRLLAPAGTAVIAGARQHVVIYEGGAAGLNSPAQFLTVDDTDGTIAPEIVEHYRAAAAHHYVTPSVVCIENTHLPSGGKWWPVDQLEALRSAAGPLAVHMDGARLFNAAVGSGLEPHAFTSHVTTVMSCLSKGLAAPVGSLLAGPADLIVAARDERQRMGGGMRQAGVIAAAGVIALTEMIGRLADDHARAARLAAAVAERWPGSCSPAELPTNIVNFTHPDTDAVLKHLDSLGIRAGTIAPNVARFVTHLEVDDADIGRAVDAVRSCPV